MSLRPFGDPDYFVAIAHYQRRFGQLRLALTGYLNGRPHTKKALIGRHLAPAQVPETIKDAGWRLITPWTTDLPGTMIAPIEFVGDPDGSA